MGPAVRVPGQPRVSQAIGRWLRQGVQVEDLASLPMVALKLNSTFRFAIAQLFFLLRHIVSRYWHPFLLFG